MQRYASNDENSIRPIEEILEEEHRLVKAAYMLIFSEDLPVNTLKALLSVLKKRQVFKRPTEVHRRRGENRSLAS